MTTTTHRGPGQRSRSLAQQAAAQIKALILANKLQPGDPLPSESELCDELGVSRSSVREAIRTLTTLRILDVQHGRGTFVGDMSLQPLVETLAFRAMLTPGDDFRVLKEVVDVRVSLDMGFAEKVAEHFAGTKNEDLHGLVDQMIAKVSVGQPFTDEDREFHTRLFAEAGLGMVSQLVTAFWDIHTVTLPHLSIPTPKSLEDTAAAHRDMLQAAEAGDADAYRRAVVAHYRPLWETLEKLPARDGL